MNRLFLKHVRWATYSMHLWMYELDSIFLSFGQQQSREQYVENMLMYNMLKSKTRAGCLYSFVCVAEIKIQ